MSVGSVSNQYSYVGTGGVDALLATLQNTAQRQVTRQLALQAAVAAQAAAQAAQKLAMQSIGAGRVDMYL